MTRPDQERFDRFAGQLEPLDDQLTSFCSQYGFVMEKNAHRQPCRVLRRTSVVRQIIDLRQDGHWLKLEYQEDLPCSVGVATYFQPPQGKRLVKRASVIESVALSELLPQLPVILAQGLAILESWSVPVVAPDDPVGAPPGWERTLA